MKQRSNHPGDPGPSAGFTLIELLVVIAILGLLVALIIPSMRRAIMIAKDTKTLAVMAEIKNGLEGFKSDNEGMYPGQGRPSSDKLKVMTGSELLARTLFWSKSADNDPFDSPFKPTSGYMAYNENLVIEYEGQSPLMGDDYDEDDAMPILYYPARLGRVGRTGYLSNYVSGDNGSIDTPSGGSWGKFVKDGNGNFHNPRSYLLIGAGLDRKYFTDDDHTNFPK
ncbi:MAG: type II secretion system protein [Phycisphaerae bacterium]